jgi:hypothetical protein
VARLMVRDTSKSMNGMHTHALNSIGLTGFETSLSVLQGLPSWLGLLVSVGIPISVMLPYVSESTYC